MFYSRVLINATKYLAALMLVTIAASLRIWPLQLLETEQAWLTFYPAVTLAALYGGFLPGFFAVVLSVICIYFAWPLMAGKAFVSNTADYVAMLVYVLNSTLIAAVAGFTKSLIKSKNEANLRLQKASEQLHSLNDQLPGSIIYQTEIDADGRFSVRYMSNGFTTYSTASPKEIIKDPQLLINRLVEEDAPIYKAARQYANTHTEMLNLDLRINKSDGSIGWINVISTPTTQENGRVLWNGLVTDITKRKQLEQKLQQNEHFLQESSKLAKIGGWLLNAQTLEAFWTPELYRMHDWEPGTKVTLQSAVATYHPDDRERINILSQKALTTGEGFTTEARKISATGRIFWVIVTCRTIMEKGTVTAIHGVLQDITERKELELKLEEERIRTQRLITELVIKDYEMQKNNIAYELHEDINQLLVVTKMQFVNIRPNQNNLQESINKGIDYLNTAIEKTNSLFSAVNIPAFRELGFIETIEALITKYRLSSSMHINFTCNQAQQLNELQHDTMLMLHNTLSGRLHCMQHKQKAQQVDINLAIKEQTIQLNLEMQSQQLVKDDIEMLLDLQILESRIAFYGGHLSINHPQENMRRLEIQLPFLRNATA